MKENKTKEQENLQGKECVQMNHDYMGFEDSLEDDDYGVILDKEGKLKGIWIPQGSEDETIPDGIVNFLMEHWGIDPNDEANYGYVH
jgi:hypothetical protein